MQGGSKQGCHDARAGQYVGNMRQGTVSKALVGTRRVFMFISSCIRSYL